MPDRSSHRLELRVATWVTLAAGMGACRSAATVFFDLPPASPSPTTSPPRSASVAPTILGTELAAEETVRPPIEQLESPDSILAMLPADAAGQVDWAAAIRDGIVKPRRARPGNKPPPDMSGFGFDFAYQGSAPMMDAVFPHSGHTPWLRCSNCHAPTRYRATTPPTMEAIDAGESCGQCHGKVSFAATSCWRCHTAMEAPGAPPARPARPEDDLVLVRRADSTAMGSGFPRGRFSHWVHRLRFTCGACHNELFAMKAGADTLTMDGMKQGRSCGACHDGKTAFAAFECARCHVAGRTTAAAAVPAPAQPQAEVPAQRSEVPVPEAGPAATEPARETVTPVPAPGGDWFVQLAAFRTREEAESFAARLSGKNIRAVAVQENQAFKVRSGPFAGKRQAEAARDSLRRQVGGDPFTLRTP